MAEYGVQTWDASGKVNNYGIKPVSVCGFLQLAVNHRKQVLFPLTFHRVAKLTYFQVMNDDKWGNGKGGRFHLWWYCNGVSVGDTDYSAVIEPAVAAFLIFQIERV